MTEKKTTIRIWAIEILDYNKDCYSEGKVEVEVEVSGARRVVEIWDSIWNGKADGAGVQNRNVLLTHTAQGAKVGKLSGRIRT